MTGRGVGRSDAALWLAAAGLLAALAWKIVSAGPLGLALPATILSAGNSFTRRSAPYLIFLAEVGRAVPNGSSLAVATSESLRGALSLDYLIAVGQLPRCRVVPIGSENGRLRFFPGTSFVASFGAELHDARLSLVVRLPHGILYRVLR